MRRTAAVLAPLLVLVARPAGAADDRLVVPGQRIGTWTLEASIDDLIRAHGPRRPIGTVFGSWDAVAPMRYHDLASRDLWVHRWDHLGVRAVTLGRDGPRVWNLGTPDGAYRTAHGIGAGATRGRVEAAYGGPTAVTVPLPHRLHLVYDDLGLAVRLADGRVDWLVVFRPGTARERWALGGGLLGR